jgi:opacity protein-like surface antigen
MRPVGYALGVCAVAMGMFCLTLPVQAEMYVAGQAGISIPNSFSNVEGVGSAAGLTLSDLSLQKSVMYGAKLGYYFDSMKWLGVETEVFNSTPHLKQQDVSASFNGVPLGTGTFSGQDVRVLNWAPVNIVVRHQMGQFEPYAGIGMGVFFANLTDGASGESSSSTNVGLNTQLGLRYKVTQNLAVFGEWKYNRASFDFSESSPTQATGGFKGDYSANFLAFGVGYHF